MRSACALLAPGTRETLEQDAGPCVTALPRVGLSDPGGVRDVEVYGLDAWVRLEHDTVFLARFDGGWRVTAAGCVPQGPGEPYSCEIERG